jgi:capsular polysaccharide transport system ATP-binding protein
MITLRGVSKHLRRGMMQARVLDGIDLAIPRRARLVVLGHHGSGKSTLLRVISGTQLPSEGQVERRGTVSPPTGLARFTKPHWSVRVLVLRLAEIYSVDPKQLLTFVTQFATLQDLLDEPVITLPGPFRARLDTALILGIPFDFYLFDERLGPTSPVGFRDACWKALEQRLEHSGMIFTTSSTRVAAQFQAAGAILHTGKLSLFPTVAEAIDTFDRLPPSFEDASIDAVHAEAEEEEEFG